jgi:cell wall-associated NlpC family hydrolase
MYIGNGQMIEAPSAGKNVRITPVRMANAMPYAGRA